MTGIIESTVYLSVTAIVILLFKWIFKNKLSAKWHVWIWALLAIRLVLPSLPESSLSIFNVIDVQNTRVAQAQVQNNDKTTDDAFAELENVVTSSDNYRPEAVAPYKPDTIQQESVSQKEPVSQEVSESTTVPQLKIEQANSKQTQQNKEDEKSETQNEKESRNIPENNSGDAVENPEKKIVNYDIVAKNLRYGGASLVFLYFVVIYVICVARTKKHGKTPDDSLLQLLDECKKRVGVKRNVKVICDGNSPMLMGLAKPKIIIPDGYTEDEKRNIIIHELCHLKGGDIYLLWLAMIILCLNWFNPVMWVCFFLFRRDIEVYCDERVLKYIDSKKDYAALLVKTALKKNSFIAGTTSLQNGEKEVERRVKYMAYFKKPNVWWTVIIILIAVVIGVVCLTDPKEEKGKENNKEKGEVKTEEAVEEKKTKQLLAADDDLYESFIDNKVNLKIGDEFYNFSQYCEAYSIDGRMEYTLFDMNGDSYPEFHLKSNRAYHIFTVKNGQPEVWYEGSPYETFTNDGGVFYTRHGGAPDRIDYQFFSLDFDGNVVSTVSFSEVHEDGNSGTADGLYFDGDGNEISYDEFNALFNKCGEIPYDHEWTVLYKGLKTEIFEDMDTAVEKDIIIQYPSVIGMQNADIQEKVNTVIEEAALERYNEYSANQFKDGFDNTSWYVDYTVAHHGKRFISIYFEGYIYTRGSAHGSDTAWTVTVDMQTGERIKLGDIFDDTFCEYVTFENFGNGAFADEEAFEKLFGTDKKDLEKAFTSESNDNFYFGDNELGINLYMYSDYYNYFTSDYESLKSCMKDHPIWEELGVKNGKVLEASPNFLLEDRGDSYYYEVYDNNGNTLLSETSEKCPAFTHLEGPLYELRFSQGTFAWESVFFNVERGGKTPVFDRPFYLENGTIACVNDVDTFDVGSPTKTGELTFIELFDLYDKIIIHSVDAEFLEESTSYLIEYVDDTHISVTYYTENGSRENKKTIEIPSLTGALTVEDGPIVETEPEVQPEIQPEVKPAAQPEVMPEPQPEPQPEAVTEVVSEADTPVVSDEIIIETDMHDVSGVGDETELETSFW